MPVPQSVRKEYGFNGVLPAGTVKQYDAGRWALYYCPQLNTSFIVNDVGHSWTIRMILGKLSVRYSQDMMKARLSQMADSGCCGD